MAGDWLKVEKSTPEKPEIEAMAEALGIDPDAVFGKLFRIWSWFDDHTTDGNAPGVTFALLDRKSCVTGFGAAMKEAGWLIADGTGLVLPNFERHNGQTSKKRAITAKRVAKHKKGNANGNATGNAKVTPGALPSALPREEKRREENIPPPPTSSVNEPSPWEDLEEEVLKEGVAKAADAIGSARRHDCTPAEVQAVLEHFREHKPAWDSGALYNRLVLLRRGQHISECWPVASGAHVKAEAKAAASKKREAQELRNAKAKSEKAADQARISALESNYGETLDAMDSGEVRELIVGNFPKELKMLLRRLKDPVTGVARAMLLEHLGAKITAYEKAM